MHPLRIYVTSLFFTSLLILAWTWATRPPPAPPVAPHPRVLAESLPIEPGWVEHEVRPGETFGSILPENGVDPGEMERAAASAWDLSRVRAGQVVAFLVDPDQREPLAMRYEIDLDRTLVATRGEEGWTARLDEIVYDRRVGIREFVVESSLWQAAVDAGLQGADIAALARVYEYDLDFNTEIQAGASARMVVEELWKDGALARLGAPQAVRLENAGKEYVAVRFQHGEGQARYYDELGTVRKKAFLRSPIEFSRVTSGFSTRRFHPILKKSRPHLGTDFGAPTGTPVRAVGDGVVAQAGPAGGHGNFVKLDHDGPYASSYSHLSRIAVRRGQKVEQGAIVGYVGSTGLSTGPHLHFQFWVGGRIVNPMTVELPRQTRLAEPELSAFEAERDRLLALLDGAGDDPAVAEATDTDEPDTSPAN